jgi:hypothetical protein
MRNSDLINNLKFYWLSSKKNVEIEYQYSATKGNVIIAEIQFYDANNQF